MAQIYNIRLDRGDTFIMNLQLFDHNNGQLDLTNSTIKFTAKRKLSDTDVNAVFQKTIGSGIEVLDPIKGQIKLTIEPDDTSGLENNNVYLEYDLQVNYSSIRNFTVLRGQLLVTPDVTLIM